MHIAICDDERVQISIIEEYIEKQNYKNIVCDTFSSGEELLDMYANGEIIYNIVFLDIEIGNENGLDIARRLRKIDNNVIIIFITSHCEYVYKAFESQPFRFLVKPVIEEKFNDAMNAAVEKLSNEYYIRLKVSYGYIRVKHSDIIYVEKVNRETIVHTVYGDYKTYLSLSNILKTDPNNFMMIHRAVIVNINYITEIHNGNIEIKNELILPISRMYRKNSKEKYERFIRRNYNI